MDIKIRTQIGNGVKFNINGEIDNTLNNINDLSFIPSASTTPFSIETIIEYDIIRSNNQIITIGDENVLQLTFNYQQSNNSIIFYSQNNNGFPYLVIPVEPIVDSKPNHFFYTYDGGGDLYSGSTIYINKQKYTIPGNYPFNNWQTITKKFFYGVDFNLNISDGTLYRNCLYSKELTENEINDLSDMEILPKNIDELECGWMFDERSGTKIYDISGNNNHGQLNNFDVSGTTYKGANKIRYVGSAFSNNNKSF